MEQPKPHPTKKSIAKRNVLKYVGLTVVLFGILFCLRWAWLQAFYTTEAPSPVDGVVDMRGVDLASSPSFFLNGPWLFYPNQLLSYEDLRSEDKAISTVKVPGDWRKGFEPDSGTSYGYGTYRLRILIDPLQQPVALWIKGIQASSSVEINGFSEGAIGKPASDVQDYTARNISYTASYTVAGTTELDVLIRVANYDEPFHGGITRSIRFGSQAAIDTIRLFSIGSQLVTIVILLLHGLYAFILYLFNRQERGLFTMALLTLSVALALMAGQDNILQILVPITYAWQIRIRLIALLWQNLFILFLFRRLASAAPRRDLWLRSYTALLVVLTGILMAAPASWANAFVDFYGFIGIYLIPFIWLFFVLGKMIANERSDRDVAFLLLTAAGIISNLIWSLFESDFDVTTVYYPLDLMITMIGFSAYWFKKYFRQAHENSILNNQLQRADKLKDQFLANTSHELRTPLHGIMNIAQNVVAKEKASLDEGSLKNMELLITISRRMSHMLGDLLDVARLQEHRVSLRQEPLQVRALVPGIVGMLQFMFQGKPVKLNIDIPESMPPVFADEQRLVQIMYNLIHNALKYTEEGTITVAAEVNKGRAVIQVADTGVGMNRETQARIFLPYEQGAHGVSDGRGIGLGLSICKQLVDLHGGTLTVQSAPGEGSMFSFDLPVANSTNIPQAPVELPLQRAFDETEERFFGLAAPDIAAEEIAASMLVPPLLSDTVLHILAVDDDPVNLNVLAGMLELEPYRITTVQSAREALELLSTRPWDLLIADVMMPQMSGYELTQRVRERYSLSELPVLLLTARSQPADIYTGFLSGASDYVTKPVDALELKYRIRALTSLKQSINERLRMEAAYLQAQIHPHFLFNTLNSILALSEIDTEQMRLLGNAFASYLRISFDFLNTGELVELAHELDLVQAYLQIEKARFGDRLKIEWEMAPGLDLLVPPLSIQPLVENAVKHGALGRNVGGTVRLRIVRKDGATTIEVSDDGRGMSQKQIDTLLDASLQGKGGIGIANTNRRLLQLYGQGLSILSRPLQGTVVSFVIPDARGGASLPTEQRE